MRFRIAIVLTLGFCFHAALPAQNAYSYKGWAFSGSGASGLLSVYTVNQGSMVSAQCMHTYYADTFLNGPFGAYGNNDGESWQTLLSSSSATVRRDDQISTAVDGHTTSGPERKLIAVAFLRISKTRGTRRRPCIRRSRSPR